MRQFMQLRVALFVCMIALFTARSSDASGRTFSLAQILDYSFPSQLVASKSGDRIAWVENTHGIRNIWVADGPAFRPRQITDYRNDDGRQISDLILPAVSKYVVYVRGGDDDAMWPRKTPPDPSRSPQQPEVALWSVPFDGGPTTRIGEGKSPAVSPTGVLAYIKDQQLWTADLSGTGKPRRLFFDIGNVSSPRWSPDGRRLAFVSDRGGHSYIGVFTSSHTPLVYLAPSTGLDRSPCWSPDGSEIAFVRGPGAGGPPRPILQRMPNPWSIWVADARNGQGHVLWRSPDTLPGSFPTTEGDANLHWASGGRLVFLGDLDNWPHLYSIPATGGKATLLTPGRFMVEDITQSSDLTSLIYDANAGTTPGDEDRRHLFVVPVDRAKPVALTRGTGIESEPVAVGETHVAFISAGPQAPPTVALVSLTDAARRSLNASSVPADFPAGRLTTPVPVTFTAPDGWTIHAVLFHQGGRHSAEPAIISVHGGPARQTLLGWNYIQYYSNTYAMNEYLASHGFVVLAVNYRLSIGYGYAFQHPDHWGPTGASEYQDVLAAARYLRRLSGVDGRRIGIWGGSYGGYLTALALARDSDVFKAGVDLQGITDWSRLFHLTHPDANDGFEQGDREAAMKAAWESSPVADIERWKSPVLIIQGDDDGTVPFEQTIDLDRRLTARGVPHQVLDLPNEVHDFLRYQSWVVADRATVDFFRSELGTRTR